MGLAGNGRFRLGGYRSLRISSQIAISLELLASSRLATHCSPRGLASKCLLYSDAVIQAWPSNAYYRPGAVGDGKAKLTFNLRVQRSPKAICWNDLLV